MSNDQSPNADPEFQQAVAEHQSGRLEEAGNLYLSVLRRMPGHADANHNMGVLAVQMLQPAAGLGYFIAALDADPSCSQYWLGYIDALHQSGRTEEARQTLALARQQGLQGEEVDALAQQIEPVGTAAAAPGANPSNREIDELMALFTQGRYDEAARVARSLTERFPDHGFGWKVLGVAHKQMGRNQKALPAMQKAAELSPRDVEAHYNLGVTLQALGRLEAAEASYRQALFIKADYADAHSNLGVVLQAHGHLEQAEASYRRALQLKPGNAAVLSNLGVVLHELDRMSEAEASFREALQVDPNNTESFSNLGNTLLALGRLDEAETCYRQALQINPVYTDALYNLGNALKDLFRLDEAEASYRQALAVDPEDAQVYCNLGALLHDRGRLDEAETCYQQALKFKPDYAEAYKNLGANLENQGHFAEAKASYRKAWELGFNGARIQEALMLPAIMGTRQEVLDSRAAFERNLDKLIADKVVVDDPLKDVGEANFYLAYQGQNDRALQIKVAKFYEQACPSLLYRAPHCDEAKAADDSTIRLGFVSRFFSSHSVSLCFSKIIEVMSHRDNFEVSLISHHPIDDKIYSGFAGKRIHLPNSLTRAREILAGERLDILVYLDIGMEPLSYFLAFARLARAQCVLGGHPVTTGVGNMDYFLSAEVMEPPNGDEHYSEKLIRLPRSLIYFARPVMPAVLKSRHELGLPDGSRLYMCPMKLQKIHPDFDAALAGILERDSNGTVVLFEDDTWPYWRETLQRRFEKTIPEEVRERIIFLPWLRSSLDFLSAIATADVLIDPFHFGIGSTAAISSVTGTPLVTKAGEFMRGRVGAGYCKMLDVPECIAKDTADYVGKAVGIANDRQLRDAISAKIIKNNPVLYENLEPVEDFVDFIHSIAVGWYTAGAGNDH